jgi:hypothetical protein
LRCQAKNTGILAEGTIDYRYSLVGSLAMENNRMPKIGDRVLPNVQHGLFVVSEIDAEAQTAELKKVGSPDIVLTVGWQDFGFLDKEDASQATTRIVREAPRD